VVLLLLVAAACAGTAFHLALRTQQRHAWAGHSRTRPGRSRLRRGVGVVAPGGGRRAVRRRRPDGGRAHDRTDPAVGPTRPRRDPNIAAPASNTGGRCAAAPDAGTRPWATVLSDWRHGDDRCGHRHGPVR
jgi:hypothetical protein